MRTAILISGQLRDAKDCFPSLKEYIINPYDADVFIDTWTPGNNVLDHRGQLIADSLSVHDTLSLYMPKMAMFEDFDNSPFFDRIKKNAIGNKIGFDGSHAWETKIENIFYMYYKVWRCFQHMKHFEAINNFKYDRVIRMRFDLVFEEFPIIETQPTTVYVPSGSDHRGGISDLLCLGDRESMEMICSLFSHLLEYAASGAGMHPESILRTHMHKCGLKINRFPLKYKLRGKYV
jgi:hypothetical protein